MARWADAPLSARALRWLLLLALLAFVLRWGGKLYPGAMAGDVGFHANRFGELLLGRVFLQAPHRGVHSPYAPLFYTALAPLTLVYDDRGGLLVSAAAILDAISVPMVYLLALLFGRPTRQLAGAALPSLSRAVETQALGASALYVLAGGGLMATWWNFSTHIFAQWAFLALLVAAPLVWKCLTQRHTQLAPMVELGAALAALQLLVLWGHFSFYLNTTLLTALVLAAVWLLALRRRAYWLPAVTVTIASAGAQLVAVGLFYSFYIGQLRTQAGAVGAATTEAVTSSLPAFRAYVESIMGEGLTAHVGLFPVALAGVGTAVLLLRRMGDDAREAGRALLIGTWLVAALFAALPLFSGANLTTRWLMFSLWAVCVAAPPAALRYWRSGRAGRVLCVLIAAYVVGVGAAIWLGALAWRIRPPEPF
jgi:hypothetical protein